MGTNYYWRGEPKKICSSCGQLGPTTLHIGKSSMGWCFSLHVIPEEGLVSLGDWEEKFKTGIITDEYGRLVSAEEMIKEITEREFKDREDWSSPEIQERLRRNGAMPGPNGLFRSTISEWHCVGHGDGTWDLIKGEFC